MKKNIISLLLSVCAAMGWWGAIYPQFTLLKGTYEIVCEEDVDGACGHDGQNIDANELYWQILDADCSRIRFKSRLLTNWYALQEHKGEDVHESGDQ